MKILYNTYVIVKLRDLANIADEKVYLVDFRMIAVEDNIFLRRLEDVLGEIAFYYDEDSLRINYYLEGRMVCPCAITLEDTDVPFRLENDDAIVRNLEEEGFYLAEDMDLEKLVLYIVLPEVPIKVVKNEKIEYYRTDDYSFVSEEEYESSKKDEIDPRLQKLKEYRFEEDE